VDLTEIESKSETKKLIWKTKVQTFANRIEAQKKNMQIVFSVIWGQCSPTMQSKLQSLGAYNARSDSNDCPWILQEIKGVTHKFEGTRYICMSLYDARQQFYNCRQEQNQSLHNYLKQYRTLVEVLDHYGAPIDEDSSILEKIPGATNRFNVDEPTNTKHDGKEAQDVCSCKGSHHCFAFLKGAD